MADSDLISAMSGGDRGDAARLRAFIQTCIGFAAVMIAYAIAINIVLPGFPLGNFIGLAGGVAVVCVGYAAHRWKTLFWPAVCFTAAGLAGIFATAAISGGVDDFVTPFFVVVPAIAGYFLGARAALVAGLATVAAVLALAALDAAGLIPDTPYSPRVFELASTAVLVTAVGLTTMTAHLFTRRAAEAAARIEQSNALLSSLARTAPVAVAMFDRDMRYIEASDRWVRGVGLPREALIGARMYDLHPEYPQRWREVHARCLAGATERAEADCWARADGAEMWLMWEARPWRDAKGRIGGLIIVSRNITEQVRAQETLKAAKRQALEASNAKSAFLAAMSHEIRTPLNAVIGLTEALLDTELDARQRKLLLEANRSGEHLLALISDVLDLSKLEAGKMALDPAPFDLRDLARGVAEMFASAAERKRVSLEVAIAPNAPEEVIADENRLRQILVNLVGNALKFTPAGRIDIRVRAHRLDAARCELDIEVADTGVGIARERIPMLFEAFEQAAASTARRFGGTGLGLAICRKLLDEMGGEIACDSAPGVGSIFRVRLPVETARADAAPRLAGDGAAPLDGALSGLCVLFVDDNAANRLVYEEMAKKLGCAAAMAGSGEEAAALVASRRFDAVVMDIEMSQMNGVEATKAIRALAGDAGRTPVIAATAHALKGDRERFLAAGMNDYVAKPVSRRALAEAVLRARRGEGPADAPSPAPAGLLDAAIVADLATLFASDNGALFAELWDSLAAAVSRLDAAGPDADPSVLRKLAHDACGVAGNLGAAALSAALRRIERAAKDGAADAAMFDGLGELNARSRAAAEAMLSQQAKAS